MNSLENIKPGDTVVYRNLERAFPAKVERVTKTQIVLEFGSRFRIDNGRKVGATRGFISGERIVPATDELLAEIETKHEHSCLVRQLKDYPWRDLPIEKLRQVFEIVKDAKGESI